MNKKEIVLIIFMFLLAILAIYLIYESNPIENKNISSKEAENWEANIAAREIEYKDKTIIIFSEYEELSQGREINPDNVEKIKNDLLDLQVPTNFKDLHLKLVLAMTKMKNYLLTENLEQKDFSEELISEIKEEYIWLKK